MTALLLVHAAATWFMVGLIWFVQVVHYPLFGRIGATDGPAYAAAHQARTTWVVAPVMLVELAAAGALLIRMPDAATITAALLLALVWSSTALLQVPRHRRLGAAHDATVIASLVITNWVRTISWSARGVIALWLLARH